MKEKGQSPICDLLGDSAYVSSDCRKTGKAHVAETMEIARERERDRQTDRDRERDRETERHRERQRETDRQKHTETQVNKIISK